MAGTREGGRTREGVRNHPRTPSRSIRRGLYCSTPTPYIEGCMDLFRCRPEYLAVLLTRDVSPRTRESLTRLRWAKLMESPEAEVDAVDALFRELVLEGGMG